MGLFKGAQRRQATKRHNISHGATKAISIPLAEILAVLRVFAADLIRHHAWRLGIIYLISSVSVFLDGFALSLIVPIFSLIGVSSGGSAGRFAQIVTDAYAAVGLSISFRNVLATLFLLTVLQQAFAILGSWMSIGLSMDYGARMRRNVLNAILRARWMFFLRIRQGEIVDVFMSEVDRASGLIGSMNGIFSLLLTAAVYSGIALLIDWKITVMLLVSASLIGIAVQFVQRAPWHLAHEVSVASTDLTNGISELAHGAKLVLIVGARDRVIETLDHYVRRVAMLGRRMQMIPMFSRSAFEILAVGLLCLALYLSLIYLHIAVAGLLAVLAIFFRLMPRMSTLITMFTGFALSIPFYRRVINLCSTADSMRETVPSNAIDVSLDPSSAAISFDRVYVGYGDIGVLRNVSLEIRRGEIVGIAGASGVGKSTLVDAIAGLLQPATGFISVNGHRMETIHPEKWRRSIGYVTQDTFLLNATLHENVSLGDGAITVAETRAALDAVGLKEFVDGLVDGMEAKIGPGGIGLSGGQRQRIGIARALVGRKQLVVFDEPTSALDAHLERLITDLIAGLRHRATVIVIAHRLSTLRVTDRVIVLDQGRVAEQGPWRELIVKPNGVFCHMWMQQMANSPGENSYSERPAEPVRTS